VQRRRLLQFSNLSMNACDRDNPHEFIFIQSSVDSQIIAGPEFLCRAGVNDIIFDVGTYAADFFSPTESSAFTMSVTVTPGSFKHFLLVNFDSSFVAQSFRLIDSLEIMFIDDGLNEVSGNATMSLVCINASVHVHPAKPFTVFSNASVKAYVPAFFLYVNYWIPSESPLNIALTTTNSTALQYRSNVVTAYLNRSCSPGHRFLLTSFNDLYTQLTLEKQNFNVSTSGMFPLRCTRCPNGTFSSHFDAQTCR
jgi:hypothetical protein